MIEPILNTKEHGAQKKIVIIAYATYPSISPRHMRTHELAKELARKGHDVTLYVLTGKYDYTAYEKDTNIKVKSLGKTYFFKFDPLTGRAESFFMKIMRKLFSRLLEFPNIELIFNTYKTLNKENNIDLLVTIAVPYPIHWGAALSKVKQKDKLKNTVWVADCGDPYMGSPFTTKPFYFKYIEKWFCKKTDYISIPIEEARTGYYPEFANKIKVIPQGFNFDEVVIAKKYIKNPIPTFIYAGIFYEKLRDPRPFLNYLETLNYDFKFIVYTKSGAILEDHKKILGKKLEILKYIPREQLIFEMSKADFLVNFENPSAIQSPSKLIDYALSRRPILSLNTNTEVNTELVDKFLSGNYENGFKVKDIEKYNINNVADEFLLLLTEAGSFKIDENR